VTCARIRAAQKIRDVTAIRAVLFDWRGTLVVTLEDEQWVERALRLARRPVQDHDVGRIVASLRTAKEAVKRQIAWDRIDCDAGFHRAAHDRLFTAAGLDAELADALYVVESDHRCNPFATDASDTLTTLKSRGVKIGILSDIHFDIRPAFTPQGLCELVDAFVLSFEHGMQKPDPAIFGLALEELRVSPAETLMVGDRASHDGAAVGLGMPTLLLPALIDTSHERLSHVLRLVCLGDGQAGMSWLKHS
jgi:HAD superfamily hydrolase (TIGR01509 family)